MEELLQDEETEKYLQDCVNIVPEAIQEEFCRAAADLAYWGQKYSEALRDYRRKELARKRLEAQLYVKHREVLLAEGNKRPTVDDIKSAVAMDEEFEEAKLLEIEAEANHLLFKNRFWAVSAKKDLLQSLGAQLRTEMGHDPIIRESVRAARQQREPEPEYEDF